MKKQLIFISLALAAISFKTEHYFDLEKNDINSKISILNLGVFHMSTTTDANKTDFDESSKKNANEMKDVCIQLAKFKPTIICVESSPEINNKLNEEFKRYVANPSIKTIFSGNEIQLLGFEIGRLSNVKKIYGIDHQLSYNYNLAELARQTNSFDYFMIEKQMKKQDSNFKLKPTLKETLLERNTQEYYNFMINYNADMLTYANSADSFEGADEAAKFYKRNLRMYANLNKIKMDSTDRVLIISGSAHAAFFNDFLRRSPKYKLENLRAYLN
ncbi:MAG TPA: DUF5694 domain-containing protein [Bacteroidia bacterium]|jgi:hypothetical protein|nr:DUF5694 domain-containing protein [Bacteroidia bacterium]